VAAGGDPSASLWQRLLLSLPRLKHEGEKRPLGERLREALLKPVDPETAGPRKPEHAPPAEEVAADMRSADDAERFIGLFAAPVAGALAIVISSILVSHNPAARLANGQPNPKHINPAVYHTLELVLIGVALAMLASAWYRKRTLLAMCMALYGIGVFNLHYWGFGIPYVLGGAWLLVRAYRLSRDGGDTGQKARRSGRSGGTSGDGRPGASKRYTPPKPPTRRPGRPTPEGEQRAG